MSDYNLSTRSAIQFSIAAIIIIILAGYVLFAVSQTDRFSGCTLYEKKLLGDKEELVGIIGKGGHYETIHYYNATYICDEQLISRIERT